MRPCLWDGRHPELHPDVCGMCRKEAAEPGSWDSWRPTGKRPPAQKPAPPCAYRSEPLTGREREAAGKDHRQEWFWCDHPQDGRGGMNGRLGLPLGEKIVCPCRGCGPTCPGYSASEAVETQL